jgi:cysteinyl-tRNA synthetase
MSKSLGNFTTIRALLDSGVSPMTLRLFVLQAHYRKPLDFTAEALEAAATGWKGLDAALVLLNAVTGADGDDAQDAITPARVATEAAALPPELAAARDRFIAAMDDDLNTSAALAVLFELARPLRALANRVERGDEAASEEARAGELQARGALLAELAAVLGLRAERPAQPAAGPGDAEIEALIARRLEAKATRDFATADAIRAQLQAQGIELIDRPGGVTDWLRN